MDAKPQRPRAWRVRDENLPPTDLAPTKTIHQRNKSTPALSSLLNVGNGNGNGNKAAIKRTAFADVSNTAAARANQTFHPAKDDLILPSKAILHHAAPLRAATALALLKEKGKEKEKEKEKGKEQEPEKEKENSTISGATSRLVKPASAALLRPAQRPLASVTHLKSAATKNVTVTHAITNALPKLTQHQHVTDAINHKAAIPRKQFASIHEAITIDVKNDDDFLPTAALFHVQQQPQPYLDVSIADESASRMIAPRSDSIGEQPAATKTETQSSIAETVEATMPAIPTPIEEDQFTLAPEEPIPKRNSDLIPPTLLPGDSYPVHQFDLPSGILPGNLDALFPHAQPVGQLEQLPRQSFGLSNVEQEEYWDEEDEEEYYDADGYTTARSIRSRCGDTTGGMTLVMDPRVTAKTVRELEAAQQYVEATKSAEDVEDEAWDTSMVAEYGEEIFQYMRDLECRMKPNPHYMDNQTEIQWSMRAVLMDWLIQVHHRFTLLPETLFLAVNYVDRFLSCKTVSLGKLQLVGATAIFVAAKYEEINCPSVQEIVFMVDSGYTMDEVLKAERFMLTMLQFELGWPGPMSFLRRISKADDYDLETRTLAKYFLEVAVMDERFVATAPSFAAAGAHCLARLMLNKGDWGLAHVHYSGYTWAQLRVPVQTMLECCLEPRKHHNAVYEKYADKRYKRSSLFVETEIQKGFRLPGPVGGVVGLGRESAGAFEQAWRRK